MQKKRLKYISLLLFITYVISLCVPCFTVRAEADQISPTEAEVKLAAAFPNATEAETVASAASPTEKSRLENSFHDIAGHWAEREIKAWAGRELAGGYPDGTFRPDSPISRAEFVALVNRAFGYNNMADNMAAFAAGQATSQAAYSDVVAKDWYATEFANAAAVGYLSGYPDGTMKPQNPVTRQEVAAVLARILPAAVVSDDNNDDGSFNDQAQIPEWSQAAIAAAVNSGYMNGYPDGTFQPGKAITRAEAVAVLERAVGTLYNGAGTYGPIQGVTTLEGNVTITTPGVTLQNTIITGNLYLTEGIGEGDVTLNNVTVKGALIANAPVRVQGQGTIETARVNVDGVVIEAPVKNVFLADGV